TIGGRAEPKTLNPVIATDTVSREVIGRMMADLIDIKRASQQTEPALAKSWKTSPDGRMFTLQLRKGIRFSDGHPFDADDVVFSFAVYMDENVDSPQRDLLIIDGKPLTVTKVDQYTVRFILPRPYAAAERLFDGLAMLPKHLLEKSYREGKFVQAWSLNTAASEIAGLGPFRLKQYVPGQRVVLERNPYYWKVDSKNERLPYLDELTFLIFNQNHLSSKKLDAVAQKQQWFRELKFRQAVSAAIDRDSIVRLVYGTRGAPLWGNVGPGNKQWVNTAIPHPQRSVDAAR